MSVSNKHVSVFLTPQDTPEDSPRDSLTANLEDSPNNISKGHSNSDQRECNPENNQKDDATGDNQDGDSSEGCEKITNPDGGLKDDSQESYKIPLLITNGEIINHDDCIKADIYIEDGIIKEIGKNLIVPEGTRTINAYDKYILPGGIDPHTHFEMELGDVTSVDDFYHGTKAAVAGGTTMIFDFVLPKKGESLVDCYHRYRRKADGKVCCDYGLHVCLPSWSEEIKKEVEILAKEHGVNSFKMFMAFDYMLNDSELFNAFEHCKNVGALAMVHAENGTIINLLAVKLTAQGITGPEGHELSHPEDVEAEAVNRACVIAKQVNCPLYVTHIMSKTAAEVIEKYRQNKNLIFAETLPAALAADGRHCMNKDFNKSAAFVTSPPIRFDNTTPLYLMNCLKRNIIEVTASDNCTFMKTQKEVNTNDFRNIPHGVNGVEDRMRVVWEKGVHTFILDIQEFVAVTSTNAAKIFNLYPRKGHIDVGSDADIVIWNAGPARRISAKTHHHAVDFNIFEGMQCHGIPEYVIVNGRVCVDNQQLKVIEGFGRYIKSPLHCSYVYNKENIKEVKRQVCLDISPVPRYEEDEYPEEYWLKLAQGEGFYLKRSHHDESQDEQYQNTQPQDHQQTQLEEHQHKNVQLTNKSESFTDDFINTFTNLSNELNRQEIYMPLQLTRASITQHYQQQQSHQQEVEQQWSHPQHQQYLPQHQHSQSSQLEQLLLPPQEQPQPWQQQQNGQSQIQKKHYRAQQEKEQQLQSSPQLWRKQQNEQQYQSPSQSKHQYQSQSPSQSKLQHQSPSQSKLQSQSPSQAKLQHQSPSQSKLQSQSPFQSKLQSQSPSQVKFQHQSQSPSQPKHQYQSQSPSQLKFQHQSQSPSQLHQSPSQHHPQQTQLLKYQQKHFEQSQQQNSQLPYQNQFQEKEYQSEQKRQPQSSPQRLDETQHLQESWYQELFPFQKKHLFEQSAPRQQSQQERQKQHLQEQEQYQQSKPQHQHKSHLPQQHQEREQTIYQCQQQTALKNIQHQVGQKQFSPQQLQPKSPNQSKQKQLNHRQQGLSPLQKKHLQQQSQCQTQEEQLTHLQQLRLQNQQVLSEFQKKQYRSQPQPQSPRQSQQQPQSPCQPQQQPQSPCQPQQQPKPQSEKEQLTHIQQPQLQNQQEMSEFQKKQSQSQPENEQQPQSPHRSQQRPQPHSQQQLSLQNQQRVSELQKKQFQSQQENEQLPEIPRQPQQQQPHFPSQPLSQQEQLKYHQQSPLQYQLSKTQQNLCRQKQQQQLPSRHQQEQHQYKQEQGETQREQHQSKQTHFRFNRKQYSKDSQQQYSPHQQHPRDYKRPQHRPQHSHAQRLQHFQNSQHNKLEHPQHYQTEHSDNYQPAHLQHYQPDYQTEQSQYYLAEYPQHYQPDHSLYYQPGYQIYYGPGYADAANSYANPRTLEHPMNMQEPTLPDSNNHDVSEQAENNQNHPTGN